MLSHVVKLVKLKISIYVMFSNFVNSVKMAWNFDKIKSVVAASYDAIKKVLAVLQYLGTQVTSDSKLGEVVVKYLPLVVTVLTKILSAADAYGGILGIVANAPVAASAQLEPVSPDKLHEDLLNSLNNLTNELGK